MTADKSHLYFQPPQKKDEESPTLNFPQKTREEVIEIVSIARSKNEVPNLVQLNLRGVNLSFMDLRGVDLSGSDLRGAILIQSLLVDANLRGADLREVRAVKAKFDRVKMSSARGESLEDSLATHGTKLNKANFMLATFCQASMRGIDAVEVNMSGADLSEATLFEANLALTNLTWANLRSANLRGSNLGWVDLQGATLRDADLTWAELQGAYLVETNLTGVDLTKTHLFRAKYDADTAWPEGFSPRGAGAIEEKYVTYHPDYP